MRHKKIQKRNKLTKIVELCPNCDGPLKNIVEPSFEKRTVSLAKYCHKCGYRHIDEIGPPKVNFITYGRS